MTPTLAQVESYLIRCVEDANEVLAAIDEEAADPNINAFVAQGLGEDMAACNGRLSAYRELLAYVKHGSSMFIDAKE